MMSVPPAAAGFPVWLRVGTLLDGTSTAPRRDVHVVYDARMIRHVSPADRPPPREVLRDGQTAPDVHAPEATLLPGLIEAHAHLFLEGGELDPQRRIAYLQQGPEPLLAAACERLPKLVRLGIAGVRDAGDKDGVGLALSRMYQWHAAHGAPTVPGSAGVAPAPSGAGGRDAGDAISLQAGSGVPTPPEKQCRLTSPSWLRARGGQPLLMPYYESPGAAIHHRGRYGSFMAEPVEDHPSLRACVQARLAAGADRIKLIPTGIINFKQGAVTSPPQMTTEEVAEIVRAARAAGRQTFAHASGDLGIDRAIEGGVDSIEHGFFVRDDQLARMRHLETAWVPTFAPVQRQIDHADRMGWDAPVVDHLRRILEQHAASLVKAHALGVLIVAGSDAGSYGVAHGTGLLYEMELMERAGLPSLAVINAATGTSARRLRYREPIGRIEPGCRSRMILTRHSPLDTVANLRKPRTILFDGAVFDTDEHADVQGL